MSRRLDQTYRSQALADLAGQLIFAPPPRRREQVLRAERLHDELDPEASYPLDYLTYRVTRYRLDHDQTWLIVGDAVAADLRLLIDSLSRSIDFAPEPGETLETINQLATRVNVSVKTIERWRRQGLRWRWVALDEEPSRIVIPGKALERFAELYPNRIETGASFTQLSESQKQRVIQRAGRLARRAEVTLNRVARHLAGKIDRSPVTVRLILEKHDERHPGQAIFADRTGPLTARQRRVIARAYRRGVSVAAIAYRFNRGRSTIYRAINEQRYARIRRLTLSYHESPAFRGESAEAEFTADQSPGPIPTRQQARPTAGNDLPEALASLFDQSLPEPKSLRRRLLRYNELKFRADQVRRGIDPARPRAASLNAFERYDHQARAERSRLVQANLPVVLSVARRQRLGRVDRGSHELIELLEEALPLLIDAVSEYNPSRSQTFESFLTNRLLQAFARRGTPEAANPQKAHRRETGERVLQRLQRTLDAADIDPDPPT